MDDSHIKAGSLLIKMCLYVVELSCRVIVAQSNPDLSLDMIIVIQYMKHYLFHLSLPASTYLNYIFAAVEKEMN